MFTFDGGWIVFVALIVVIDIAMFYIGRKFTKKI